MVFCGRAREFWFGGCVAGVWWGMSQSDRGDARTWLIRLTGAYLRYALSVCAGSGTLQETNLSELETEQAHSIVLLKTTLADNNVV